MKKIIIVMLAVSSKKGNRKFAELLENFDFFKSEKELIDYIIHAGVKKSEFSLFELTDFMDACNNQEINLVSNWVSYVQMSKKAVIGNL